MLSAHCVCATLNAEHAVIRQTIASLDELLRGAAWCQSSTEREHVAGLMRFLQQFDDSFHTPNERRLAVALKGRSVEADRLMNDLAADGERDTAMLSRALQLLPRLDADNAVLMDSFAGVFRQHRSDVLRRIQTEERSLQEMAKRLLSEDEWAQIASEMSWSPKVPPMDEAQGSAPVVSSAVAQRRRADDIAARLRNPHPAHLEFPGQRTSNLSSSLR
ncbi:MAG TPA: hypothetical protein VE029_10110 [Rhizobacter sp.]|nr:hypothetical protein [Rhizobacter sp.]